MLIVSFHWFLLMLSFVQILIGPSDWEDYLRGKEGSARYRIHNLPEKLGPGVYELGIAVSRIGLGREVYKLDPDRVIVVYLGKADNVRTRLQQYGRTGAHLSNTYLLSKPDDSDPAYAHKGKGFFEEIFSQGYPIVYRWAPVRTYASSIFLFFCSAQYFINNTNIFTTSTKLSCSHCKYQFC